MLHCNKILSVCCNSMTRIVHGINFRNRRGTELNGMALIAAAPAGPRQYGQSADIPRGNPAIRLVRIG